MKSSANFAVRLKNKETKQVLIYLIMLKFGYLLLWCLHVGIGSHGSRLSELFLEPILLNVKLLHLVLELLSSHEVLVLNGLVHVVLKYVQLDLDLGDLDLLLAGELDRVDGDKGRAEQGEGVDEAGTREGEQDADSGEGRSADTWTRVLQRRPE